MSYSASDLADDVQEMLTEIGYTFDEDTAEAGRPGHFWRFGEFCSSDRYPTGNEAAKAALADFLSLSEGLQGGAARVIGRWVKGNLACAVNELQDLLDHSIPGDVETYIAEVCA